MEALIIALIKAVPCYVLHMNARKVFVVIAESVKGLKCSCFGLFEEWRRKEFSLERKSDCRFALASKSATKRHNGG